VKTLYLLRHAKSSWDDPSIVDFDRPLNKRGLRDAPFMGKLLAGMGEMPGIIVTSPARRALTTARLFAEAFGLPPAGLVEIAPLYAASPETILDVISELDDAFESAMVVGHNPGLTQVAAALSPGALNHMPTCSVAAFSLDVDSWMKIRPGTGRMRFFETPKHHSKS
jgi:phosphohistidine phosphatase